MNKKKVYKLGDVIRLKYSGGCYTTYKEAFKHFNIRSKNIINKGYAIETIIPKDYDKSNWVIVGIAFHGHFDKILIYCIENHRGERLVSGSDYFELRPNVKTKFTEHLAKKNNTYEILQIVRC